MEAREHTQANLSLLRERLGAGRLRSAEMLVGSLHPSEVARLLESLPLAERAVIWEMVDPEYGGEILVELADEVRDGLIESMQADEVIAALDGMEVDDLADLVADLPEALTREVLRSMDHQDRDRLHAVLSYDEESAGGLMNARIREIKTRLDGTVQHFDCELIARGEGEAVVVYTMPDDMRPDGLKPARGKIRRILTTYDICSSLSALSL